MNIQPPSENWLDTLFFTAVAGFAGLIGYLMRNFNSKTKIVWSRAILELCASGFVGFLTLMLCRAMQIPYEWTGFITGVLGWLGATATMQIFERMVRSKLGLKDTDPIPSDEETK